MAPSPHLAKPYCLDLVEKAPRRLGEHALQPSPSAEQELHLQGKGVKGGLWPRWRTPILSVWASEAGIEHYRQRIIKANQTTLVS
jgi:hypothetical protein